MNSTVANKFDKRTDQNNNFCASINFAASHQNLETNIYIKDVYMLSNNSMGTETKTNCFSENTSDTARVQKVIDNQNVDINNTYCNSEKQSSSQNQSSSSSKVPFVPLHIHENDVIEGAQRIICAIRPHWNLNYVEYKKSELKALDKPLEQKTALAAHCTTTSHSPNFEDVQLLDEESNYSSRLLLEMMHINDVPHEKRFNFKRDAENLAQVYRYTIQKHKQ